MPRTKAPGLRPGEFSVRNGPRPVPPIRRRDRRTAYRAESGRLRARLFSLVLMLFVLGLIYSRAKDAKTWSWLAKDPASTAVASLEATPPVETPSSETIVPGPTDLDDAQQEEIKKLLAAITDRQKLVDVEMPAYWRLLAWAQAQPYEELVKRSQHDVPLTKLNDQPDLYRGKPLSLRLNIRRVLDFDAPKNSVGVNRVYEAWGWTNDSKARPYVVVFTELPPGMKPGTEVEYEANFAGYFLKWMRYETYKGAQQSAPLLLGRLKPIPVVATPAKTADWSIWEALLLAGGITIIAIGFRSAFRRNAPPRRLIAAEADEASAMEFFQANASVTEEVTDANKPTP